MDIDPLTSPGQSDERVVASADARARQLNNRVAIMVALLATFMGICKVKDDNIVQAMQQAQADKLDHWNFYQARNVRQDVAQAQVDQLQLTVAGQPAAVQARYAPAIARYQSLVLDQKQKKDRLRAQAEADQKQYDALNYRDDQFDLADALTAIAISLLALTSLTQRRWLFWVATVTTLLGALMGVAGLAGWHLHPDALSTLLS
jgi:hypothetical protein